MFIEKILSLIGEKRITKFLLEKENLKNNNKELDLEIWSRIYKVAPDFKEWLEIRELQLLKSQLTKDNKDFILGQLYENNLYKKWFLDASSNFTQQIKEEENKKVGLNNKEIITKKEFISKWNKE